MTTTELMQHLWLATLALSVALVVVALLRVPWRRVFGAEQACHLWWLPALSLIASQLPHSEPVSLAAHIPTVFRFTAETTTSALSPAAASLHGHSILLWVWLAGAVSCLSVAAWCQWRFLMRLRSGCSQVSPAGLPLWRAADKNVGPALVGLWRPRIVIPADFDQRYDARERKLILAHEMSHAQRRDTLAAAVAQFLLALFWFNPLAWWALRRLRADQELACDAAVMQSNPRTHRTYALALLKTQTCARVMPLACPWPGHPIKERIAMLRLSKPGRARRATGFLVASMLTAALTGTLYAATSPLPTDSVSTANTPTSEASTYQLAMVLTQGSEILSTPTVCVKSGTNARIEISQDDNGDAHIMRFDLVVAPLGGQQVQVAIDGSITDASGEQLKLVTLNPVLRGTLGKIMSVSLKDKHAGAPLSLAMTPSAGCSAVPPPPAPPAPSAAPTPPAPPAPSAVLTPPAPMASAPAAAAAPPPPPSPPAAPPPPAPPPPRPASDPASN